LTASARARALVLLGFAAGGAAVPLAAAPHGEAVQTRPAPASRPAPIDRVVARVGGEEILASDAFQDLLFHFRGDSLEVIRKLAGDSILRREAQKYAITPDPKDIDEGVASALQTLRTRVDTEYGQGYDLERFLGEELSTTSQEYESQLRAFVEKGILAGLVIRFDSLHSERVVIRHIAVADEKGAKEILAKLQGGADFAAVARQESLAPTKADGGKLPPFDREFDHPMAKLAFELPVGGLGGPVVDTRAARPIYHVIKVLERVPPKGDTFAPLADAIRKGLRERPIERFEFEAYMRKMERVYPVEILGRSARMVLSAPAARAESLPARDAESRKSR
jgi:peptidyl-prolyl cis-trans isomerase C